METHQIPYDHIWKWWPNLEKNFYFHSKIKINIYDFIWTAGHVIVSRNVNSGTKQGKQLCIYISRGVTIRRSRQGHMIVSRNSGTKKGSNSSWCEHQSPNNRIVFGANRQNTNADVSFIYIYYIHSYNASSLSSLLIKSLEEKSFTMSSMLMFLYLIFTKCTQ